jgi:alkyl hydroperoxide reductase subunit D
MTITINGNWLEQVKESIPDHAKDIKLNLDSSITFSGLATVDAHACAYVAALASSNGGLAFEIEMNSPLFLAEAEREAAKTAAALMGMNNVWYTFVDMVDDPDMKGLATGLHVTDYSTLTGVSKKKFAMYALCASIVGKCQYSVQSNYDILKAEGMTIQELMAVGRIAAVIHSIGKIAI